MRNLLILAFGLVIGLVATAEAAPQCVIVYSLGEVKFSGCSQTEKESIENALQAIKTPFSLEEDLQAAHEGSAEYFRRVCRRTTPSLEGFDKCAAKKALPEKLIVDHHQVRWYIHQACHGYADDLGRLARCAQIIGFEKHRAPGWLVKAIKGYQALKTEKAKAAQTLKQFKTCQVGEGGVGVVCEPAQSGAGPLALWALLVAFFRRWREEKEPKNDDNETVSLTPVDPLTLPGDRGRRREWVIPVLTTAFVVVEILMGDWAGVIFGLVVFIVEKLGVFK